MKDVINYVNAANHAIKRLETLPLCNRLIREVHYVLMQGLRGGEKHPGEFRISQNCIGGSGATVKTANYIPPNPQDMIQAMSDLEIIMLFLLDRKILSMPTLYVSYFLKKNQSEYYSRLSEVRTKGNYEQWVKFFLRAINESAQRH